MVGYGVGHLRDPRRAILVIPKDGGRPTLAHLTGERTLFRKRLIARGLDGREYKVERV